MDCEVDWNKQGSAKNAAALVFSRKRFSIAISGPLGRVLGSVLGAGAIGITPMEVKLIFGGLSLLAIVGVVLLAISKGYKVTGKLRRPSGDEYEVSFEPPPEEP